MPRICPKCGAQIPAGFDSCPVCSKTPEDDVQIYTPRAAAPVQPKSSKRRVLPLPCVRRFLQAAV